MVQSGAGELHGSRVAINAASERGAALMAKPVIHNPIRLRKAHKLAFTGGRTMPALIHVTVRSVHPGWRAMMAPLAMTDLICQPEKVAAEVI